MLSRRITACACALALLAPAAASAMPPHDPPSAAPQMQGSAGDTKNDLHNQAVLTAPARGTESLDAAGSLPPSELAAAYGRTNTDAKPVAPAHASIVSTTNDGTNGWRIAAVIEAGVLAFFAVTAAVLLAGRQRRPRMGL